MKIEVDGVSAGYGRVSVLSSLDWSVGVGVTGLLGPNGAGKTTLLHLFAGIVRPRSGSIVARAGGRSVASTQRAYGRWIGFLPQHFTLAPELRVVDTVSYAAWVNGVPKASCVAAAEAALDDVDLLDRAADRVRSLSGGQRQRLGLAAVLAHDPELLILDEPTVGLDPAQRLRLRDVVATIGTRRTVIVSTHLVDDVTYMCDRVGVLAGGRIAFDGTVEQLAELVEDNADARGRGSAFEQAYAGIVAQLGSRYE
ncbi:ATP-binding cassette domain-containing protein [Actinoplanes sp. NPDC049316]|uniref:ATP-binding cassette domain-containing protein n=1 Tax=Actinoplanes sp. NPDC049316 TaxID=3154727 RepID=UPI003438F1F7